MTLKGPRELRPKKIDRDKLDSVVTHARSQRDLREQGYRDQSLRIHAWVCGMCGREFTRENLHELTVHHKDFNHDNNPADGSNWEHLCRYCHDHVHAQYEDFLAGAKAGVTGPSQETPDVASHNPFADLKNMMNDKKR